MPRVSIILPTHNRPALLAEAIASVRAQNCADWELIVVDDASTPPAAIPDDPRIRLVRQAPAGGGAAAKNRGIADAHGTFVAYLDDDDLYDPAYLERALAAFDRHPEIDVVFMGVAWFGSNGAWGQTNYDQAMERFLAHAGGQRQGDLSLFDDALIPALLKSVPMAFQRPVVRRAALQRIGAYRADCLLWDCDWAIRAALEGRAALIHTGLYRQRAEGQGYSSRQDRTLEHLHSGIEIAERLFQLGQQGVHARFREAFRQAARDAWFNLAWHHYLHGHRRACWKPLMESVRRQPGVKQMKLLLRLLTPLNPGGLPHP